MAWHSALDRRLIQNHPDLEIETICVDHLFWGYFLSSTNYRVAICKHIQTIHEKGSSQERQKELELAQQSKATGCFPGPSFWNQSWRLCFLCFTDETLRLWDSISMIWILQVFRLKESLHRDSKVCKKASQVSRLNSKGQIMFSPYSMFTCFTFFWWPWTPG